MHGAWQDNLAGHRRRDSGHGGDPGDLAGVQLLYAFATTLHVFLITCLNHLTYPFWHVGMGSQLGTLFGAINQLLQNFAVKFIVPVVVDPAIEPEVCTHVLAVAVKKLIDILPYGTHTGRVLLGNEFI
jgi:3-polyprenyl-4-hydroxybenzoate decarboxylase